MNHMHAAIPCKLPFQCSGQRGIKFEKEQMRIRSHPSSDFTRVHAFPRAILRDHARLSEIHLARDAFHQCLRTGNDGRDLERTLGIRIERKSIQSEFSAEGDRAAISVNLSAISAATRSIVALPGEILQNG